MRKEYFRESKVSLVARYRKVTASRSSGFMVLTQNTPLTDHNTGFSE